MGLYEETYNQLNTAQKEAVDYIDGPLLVVAGPGTGKTQLLSMRVANIIRSTDTDPNSILCLTFTNKAAINMRQRLLDLTGGEAKGVMIKTFHSFAAELMNMYPDYFWNGAKLSTAPDATQLDIIQSILAGLPLSSPLSLKFAGNYTAGRDVKNALKYVKEAGLTPDKLEALVKANLAYINQIEPQVIDALSAPLSFKKLDDLKQKVSDLPDQGLSNSLQPLQDLGHVIKDSLDFAISQDQDTGKTTNTGKWKQRWLQTVDGKKGMHKEIDRNNWWLNLAGVYQSYRSELHQRGYYDYSDMIVEVITQLQNHPTMRADAQEKFLYVLIDEFQDTNAAQLQLAHLIADHPENHGMPNLMAVGDDDQSIYKFNGAELNNMLSFQKSYPSSKLIILTENYRSSQSVLDTSTKIIDQVADRLVTRMPGLDKSLIAKNENIKDQNGTLIHRSFATEDDQLSSLARDIAKRYKTGDTEIAVLSRNHQSLRRMAAILNMLSIPVSYEQQTNILEQGSVQQVFLIASLIVSIQDGDKIKTNELLAKLLRSPMWKIPAKDLWHIAIANRNSKSWLDELISSKDPQLNNLGNWLVWLAVVAENEPLAVTLEYIIGLRAGENLTSPLKKFYLTEFKDSEIDSQYMRTLSSLRLLVNLANDFARSQSASLSEFVEFIKLSIDSQEIIADETSFVTGDEAVELLTVHKAKGLEFGTVYIVNAIDANWRPSGGGRKCPANLPLQPNGDDQDDYARLMYVAATRAKHSIIAGSYREDTTGKEVMATPLLHGVLDISQVISDVDKITVLEEHLSWPELNIEDQRLNLTSVLQNYSLSVSGLLDFLDLSQGGPNLFLEHHLLHLPESTNASMAFGTAIHAALEFAQISVNAGGLNIAKVLDHFETTLAEQFLPTNEYQKFLIHGKDLLTKLLKSDTFWLGKGDLPEQSLGDVTIGEARIKGVLDRINIKDGHATIIDYKTGQPLGSFTTKDRTKEIKAWRHRTQLTYYALLLNNSSRFKPKSVSGQMWYVEASAAKELIREYTPSPEELEKMSRLIEKVWDKIQTLNLPDVSNYGNDYSSIKLFEQDLLDGNI